MRVALLTYSTRPRGGVVHTLALAEALAGLGAEVDVWSLARGGDGEFFRAVDPRVGLRLVPFPDVAGEPVGARILRSVDTLARAFCGASGGASNGASGGASNGASGGGPGGASDGGPGTTRYDVVHAQDCISANAVPHCIRTVHHLDTFTTPELVACHERAIVRPYAHVCVSAAVAAELEAGWGVRAEVIPNGVDAARFAAAARDHSGRRAWADRLGRYVLAVGGIEPRKGTVDLVRAMAQVQRARPELRLVVAGGETLFDYRDYRQAVQACCAELGVEPVVLGPVGQDELPSLVAQAEAFAFPSTKEGFGLAAMEALAAGVPVVARDLPVLREVFGSAVTYSATPAELGTALLAAAGARDEQRASRGRQLAFGYTWEAAARTHLELYTRVGPGGTNLLAQARDITPACAHDPG